MITKKEVIGWLNLYIEKKRRLIVFLMKKGELGSISSITHALNTAEEMVNILTLEKEGNHDGKVS